ncbi:MAG: hypothetical protein NWF07_11730 [Candidatus Bathyarchaeota archaeon]|nr:hypothetical protein [Candidatus Bathyarchaeota archaeon]
MEQSTLKCVYEFTDGTREFDCTNCEIKKQYYKDIYNHKADDITLFESEQPILVTT